MFRLKGRGLPSYGNRSKGDMVIKLAVGIPTKLSERQRWLLEELHKSGNI
jgi:DnaJ-class molecular chaperone